MKIFALILTPLFLFNISFAEYEEDSLYQVITFSWDDSKQTLQFLGTGSGTFIDGNILTNKHVININDTVADFVLLCKSGTRRKSNQMVHCNIPAVVTAVHSELDIALIKPLKNNILKTPALVESSRKNIGDSVRLLGFPITTNDIQNFGGSLAFEAFKKWNTDGGTLEIKGENVTITRGKITGYAGYEGSSDIIYYATDAKGYFGMSGGAVFDRNGRYIGLPTLINSNKETYVLTYALIKNWFNANMLKSPIINDDILNFYNEKLNAKTSKSKYIPLKTVTKKQNPNTSKKVLWDIDKKRIEGQAAQYLYDQDIISGRPDGRFDGRASVNRAELAKFLLLAKKIVPKTSTKGSAFPDIVRGSWYEKYVQKAYSLGILRGYPNGNFKPSQTVNTAEFLKMLTKTFHLPENLSHQYLDVNEADWFHPYAGIAAQYDLFPNRSIKVLSPAKALSRNEVSVAIWRILEL